MTAGTGPGPPRPQRGRVRLLPVLCAAACVLHGACAATSTATVTVTLPTGTETLTVTLPTWTASVSATVTVTSTQVATETTTATSTVTLPSLTMTFTLPTTSGSVTRTVSSTQTLPTDTVTVTLPSGVQTNTQTFSLVSASFTSTFTMPSFSESLTMPTASASGTVTLPTQTGTPALTTTITIPSTTLSASLSLPSSSFSRSPSFSLPTETPSGADSVTLPTVTTTATVTATLPSMTLTVTLPSGTLSGTLTQTVSHTASASLPTLTETDTYSFTLPTGSTSITLPTLTTTASGTITFPSATDTRTVTGSITVQLPTATRTDTTTFTLPTGTLTGSVTLPSFSSSMTVTQTETKEATMSRTGTESVTETLSQSLSESITPSETFSVTTTSTATQTLTFTKTIPTFDNFTGSFVPSGRFVEGQELRVRLQTILGVPPRTHDPKRFWNLTDQGSLELRLYLWNADIAADCRNYTHPVPGYGGTLLFRHVGFGMSIRDYYWPDHVGVNTTFVGEAFVTFTAPSHRLPFVVCFKHTMNPADQMLVDPLQNGVWQTLVHADGAYAFQSAPGGLWYDLPEPGTSGAFVPLRLVNYEVLRWNFTAPGNCSALGQYHTERRGINVSTSRWGAPPELEPTPTPFEPTWECLRGDTIKLVPAGSPCTYEVHERDVHPYLGSYAVAEDGRWQSVAVAGIFEGATSGGVGIFGTNRDNPVVGEATRDEGRPPLFGYEVERDRFGRQFQVATVYLRLPVVPQDAGSSPYIPAPKFEVCFSSAEQRLQWRTVGENYTHPEDIPMWRKLSLCAGPDCGKTTGEVAFPVSGERIAWTMLDLSPNTWGVLRFSAAEDPDGLLLNRMPVVEADTDHVRTVGGDRWRLVRATQFAPVLPPLAGQTVAPAGSMSPSGCWLPLGQLEAVAERSAESPRAGTDLTDDPTELFRQDDLPEAEAAYGLVRLPPAEEEWYVCYRRGGGRSNWRILPWAGGGDATPAKWRRIGDGYLPAFRRYATGLMPLISGYYGTADELVLANTTVQWLMNDTRAGTWGPMLIETNGPPISSEPSRGVRDAWEWYRSPLYTARGTSLRLVPQGDGCDALPDNMTDQGGRWVQYDDAGGPECWPDRLEATPQVCAGSTEDRPAAAAVYFYLTVPPVGRYRVCVRRGVLNWHAVPSAWAQFTADGFTLVTTPAPDIVMQQTTTMTGVTAAVLIEDADGTLIAGEGGDLMRITAPGEMCDITPQRWAGEAGLGGHLWADPVLSLICPQPGYGTAALSGLSLLPCAADPNAERIRPLGLVNLARASTEDIDDVVPYDSPWTPDIRYAVALLPMPQNLRSAPWRLCYRSHRTSNWVWSWMYVTAPLPYEFGPPAAEPLLAGELHAFSMFFADRITDDVTWPGHFHAKVVRVRPHLQNDNCLNPADGGEGAPFTAHTHKFVKDGRYIRFSIELPVLPGRYRLCTALNDTLAWRSQEYAIVDNGLRWFAPTSSIPTNLGVSPLGFVRCHPGSTTGGACAPEANSETFNADPGGDSIKIVPWYDLCTTGIHVGLEGLGQAAITDLGPGDGPIDIVEHVVSWPAVPGGREGQYKVCVHTYQGLRDREQWVAVAEAQGLPYQEPSSGRGLRTLPEAIGAWGYSPALAPLDNSTAPQGPVLVAGALTTFIAGAAGPDPAVAAGFWFEPSEGLDISPSRADFKLVPWPECQGFIESLCGQQQHCRWVGGTCEDTVGVVSCRVPGAMGAGTDAASCGGVPGELAASCPSLSTTQWSLPPEAGGRAVGAQFHLPPAGRYIVCLRQGPDRPWLWLPWVGGMRSLRTVDSALQFDALGARVARPGHNVTLYDVAHNGDQELSSWCGGTNANCRGHWHDVMRQDWVSVVNDTQVCAVGRFPSLATGWYPLVPTGQITAAVAPRTENFALPPGDRSDSGRYRVCVLKLKGAVGPDGLPLPGAVTRQGVAYSLWNRVDPSLGSGGGTGFFASGGIDGLSLTVSGVAGASSRFMVPVNTAGVGNASTRFMVWTPELRQYYESVDEALLYDPQSQFFSRSALIHAGDVVQVVVRATSGGLPVSGGSFPIRIELCYGAATWGDLECPVRAFELQDDPFTLVNTPFPGGCPAADGPTYGWPSSGRTQFLVDGEVTYRLTYLSLCQYRDAEANKFAAGCGLRFLGPEGSGLASPSLWLNVIPRYPDGILLDEARVAIATVEQPSVNCTNCARKLCYHREPCTLQFAATLRGPREFGPAGVASIAHTEPNATTVAKAGNSVMPVPQAQWGSGGLVTWVFTPVLLDTVPAALLPVRFTFTGPEGRQLWVFVQVNVTRLVPSRVALHSLVPADLLLGTTKGRTPTPTWAPTPAPGPGVYGESAWVAQQGQHLEALAPYEVHFQAIATLPSGKQVALSSLEGWEVSVGFAEGSLAQKYNRVLEVPEGLNSSTVRLTAPRYVRARSPTRPKRHAIGDATPHGPGAPLWEAQFRIFSNEGCTKLVPCTLVVTLSPLGGPNGWGGQPVSATITTPVRVPATVLKVHTGAPRAAVHEGVRIALEPGTENGATGGWLADEFHYGEVYTLLAAGDGIRTPDGVALDDTVGNSPTMHPLGAIAVVPQRRPEQWGAVFTLRPTAPCDPCGFTFHTTGGLGPTSDGPVAHEDHGSAQLAFYDATERATCPSVLAVEFSSGTTFSSAFDIRITAATVDGTPTIWPRWWVVIDPAADLLAPDGTAYQGQLRLSRRGATQSGVLAERMGPGGSALFSKLLFEAPEITQQTVRIRARVLRDTSGGALSCETYVELQSSATAPGIRRLSVAAVYGARPLCTQDPLPVLGCEDYVAYTEPRIIRLEARYFRGTDADDLVGDAADNELTLRVEGRIVAWAECAGLLDGSCATTPTRVTSPHRDVVARSDGGTPAVLSQGSSVIRFRLHKTNGFSAPSGVGHIDLEQQNGEGLIMATPVREATFEVCDAATEAGILPSLQVPVQCRRVRLWILPASGALDRRVALVDSSTRGLETDLLVPGAPGCGPSATVFHLSVAALYMWGGVPYLLYDAPLEFSLRHLGGQLLVSSVAATSTLPALSKANGLTVDMGLHTRLGRGSALANFSFYGLRSQPPESRGLVEVSAADAGGDAAVPPIATVTAREYRWTAAQQDSYGSFRALPAPEDDDECPRKRALPANTAGYWAHADRPGRGWTFAQPGGAVAGLPFPVQMQVGSKSDGSRAWAFPPSPVLLVKKGRKSGCNDGGTATLYRMQSSADDAASVLLDGELGSTFVEVPGKALTSLRGQATLWTVFSEPCQECFLEIALCYAAAAVQAGESCFVGATQAELDQGPAVGLRSYTTQTFTVREALPNSVVITAQSAPESAASESEIRVGQPFEISLAAVVQFPGGWLLHPPAEVTGALSPTSNSPSVEVAVFSTALVRWSPRDVTAGAALRFGNGGWMGSGQSAECEVSPAGLRTPTRAPWTTRTEVVYWPTASEISLMRRRRLVPSWLARPLRFYFTRPCLRCEVWVHSMLYVRGAVAAEVQHPLRVYDSARSPGGVLHYKVTACDSGRWILAGYPPTTVRRLKPFSVTAWRVDTNNFPVWQGALPATVGLVPPETVGGNLGGAGGGGEMRVTSPLEQAVPPTARAAGGAVTFRMQISRSCFRCAYRIADVDHYMMVVSTATRFVVSPIYAPVAMQHDGGRVDRARSDLWQYEVYAADELGDRAYSVGGPTFVEMLPAYRQVGVANVSLGVHNPTADVDDGVLRHAFLKGDTPASWWPADPWVKVIERRTDAVIAHGRSVQNGVPMDSVTPEVMQLGTCAGRCGLPAVVAVELRGWPTMSFPLQFTLGPSDPLPSWEQGSRKTPVLRWAPAPSIAIFDEEVFPTGSAVVSGKSVTVRALAVGGLPHAGLPLDTHFLTAVAFQAPVLMSVRCNLPGWFRARQGAQGQWQARSWNSDIELSWELGVADVEFQLTLEAVQLDETRAVGALPTSADCSFTMQPPPVHSSATRPTFGTYGTGALPRQGLPFRLYPRSLPAADLWRWVDSDDTTIAASESAASYVASDRIHTLRLRAFGTSVDGDTVVTSAAEVDLGTVVLETAPAGCFEAIADPVLEPSGTTLQWRGIFHQEGACQLASVSGLPAGPSGDARFVSLSLRSARPVKVVLVPDPSNRQVNYTGLGGTTSDGTVAAVAGTPATITFAVVNADGDVVRGDHHTTLRLSARRCIECCRLRYGVACTMRGAEGDNPEIPSVARTKQGLATFTLVLPRSTRPSGGGSTQTVAGIVVAAEPHIPWAFNFSAEHSAPGVPVPVDFGAVEPPGPLHVVIHAQRLRVFADFSGARTERLWPALEDGAPEGTSQQPPGGGSAPVPRWVEGYPFSLRVDAVDTVAPEHNVPKGPEEVGSDAAVSFAPVAVPCYNVDIEGFRWCRTCGPQGSWQSDEALIRRTCLDARHTDSGPGWGLCESVPIPMCGTPQWRVGNGTPSDQSLTLNGGTGHFNRIIFDSLGRAVPPLQYLQLATDELWGGLGYYVVTAALRIDRTARLLLTGQLVPNKQGCRGQGCEDCVYNSTYRAYVCTVLGRPFLEPPPPQPVRGDFGVFYIPPPDPWKIHPAADGKALRGPDSNVFNIEAVLQDELGNTVGGDDVSTFLLQVECIDPNPSRRQRFKLGHVPADGVPGSRDVVQPAPSGGHIAKAQGGVVRFRDYGFHGYCSRATLVVRCVTPADIDTLGVCRGRAVRSTTFEVGDIGDELAAPAFPPQDESPQYYNPAVVVTLGRNASCHSLNATRFAAAVVDSVRWFEPLVLKEVIVHAACHIPSVRIALGIMGMDYRDSSVCCPNFASAAPLADPAPLSAPIAPAATETLLPQDVGPRAAPVLPPEDPPMMSPEEQHMITGALSLRGCPGPRLPEYHVGDTATAAVRCCGSGVDGSGCASMVDGVCLPGALSFSEAETQCAASGLRLCEVDEVAAGRCCDSSAAGCGYDSAPVWTATAALRQGGRGDCSVQGRSDMLPSSPAGYDRIAITGTLQGCLLACCSMPAGECVGFSRGRYADEALPATCWLKRPHPASVRRFSTAYVLHIVRSDSAPAAAPQDPPQEAPVFPPVEPIADCANLTDEPNCTAQAPECRWSAGRCERSQFCPRDHYAKAGECLPCPGGSTSPGGFDASAGDTECLGCDGKATVNGTLRGAKRDACGICGGDGRSCSGCDGQLGSGAVLDPCGVCPTAPPAPTSWPSLSPAAGNGSSRSAAPSAEPTQPGPCESCAVTPADATPGLVVTRGPHWVHGEQDLGVPGKLHERGDPCQGGYWWAVRWEPVYDPRAARFWNRTSLYRVGCEGLYDLARADCVAAQCPYRDCAAASGGRDLCETLGCTWERKVAGFGGDCRGQLAHAALCPCAGGTMADCAALSGCEWVRGRCRAARAACGMDQRVELNRCVPCPPGTSNTAGDDPDTPLVNTTCRGCNGIRGGPPYDVCGVCGGDNSSCKGCDGVPLSGKLNDSCGVCGGDGSSCAGSRCGLHDEELHVGRRVVRGPDWMWGTQDNGRGSGGWVVERKDACSGGHWWTVRWEHEVPRRGTPDSWYRAGCDGKYDLADEGCARRACPVRTCSDAADAAQCGTLAAPQGGTALIGCIWIGGKCTGAAPYPTERCRCHTSSADCNAEAACVFIKGVCIIDLCWSEQGRTACEGADTCNVAGLCEPATGVCPPAVPKADGTQCDDGFEVTLGDRCLSGRCQATHLCDDDPAGLESLAFTVHLVGYEQGMKCGDVVGPGSRLALSCSAAWSGWALRQVCCFTCHKLEQPTATATLPAGASAAASRRLLQQQQELGVIPLTPADQEVPLYPDSHLVLEFEVILDPVAHPVPGAEAARVYRALYQAFHDRSAPMCQAYPGVCASLTSICNELIMSKRVVDQSMVQEGELRCPILQELQPLPVPTPRPPTPPPATPRPPPTLPDPLSPAEVLEPAGTVAPAMGVALAAAALALLSV